MRYRISLIWGIIASLIFVSLVFSQETQTEPDIQWLWGEVLYTDIQNKDILVKYLDFESDQEKEINIDVDEKTTFENIKSFDEIKTKDNVSVDYTINADGKNIAKNIVVEKSEEMQEVPAVKTPSEKTEIPPKPEQ